jgi:hypothetical protein
MTPLQIRMMLHYYAISAPYAVDNPQHADSLAVREQRQRLINDELIEPDETSGSGFRATDRGDAYVEALCAMPLPIKKWVMPDAA